MGRASEGGFLQARDGAPLFTIREQLALLRRRAAVIVLAVVVVPGAAYWFSTRQAPLYQSTTELLLNQRDVAADLTGFDPTGDREHERYMKAQAELARIPAIVEPVARAAGVDDLLGSSAVVAEEGSSILRFRVRNSEADRASAISLAYVGQYMRHRREADLAAIGEARAEVKKILAQLESEGRQGSYYQRMVERDLELRTLASAPPEIGVVVRSGQVSQLAPTPVRNAAFGLGLGLMVGIALAFLIEALDTRVRSSIGIADRLGLPLLARLPRPPRRLRRRNHLVMLADRRSKHAEAFRMLRTNLDYVARDAPFRSLLVTSAVEKEGKSTTAANLAVALARAGRRVILVDLDLRRPFVARLFAAEGGPGVTDVVLDGVPLEEALVRVAVTERSPGRSGSSRAPAPGNGRGRVEGLLEILPAGPIPPDAGDFASSAALGELLAELSERADVVVVDAPPLLAVGDAAAISAHVDALLLVLRLEVARERMLDELGRTLDHCPAAKLGFVVTGAAGEDDYGSYGYRSYAETREPTLR